MIDLLARATGLDQRQDAADEGEEQQQETERHRRRRETIEPAVVDLQHGPPENAADGPVRKWRTRQDSNL